MRDTWQFAMMAAILFVEGCGLIGGGNWSEGFAALGFAVLPLVAVTGDLRRAPPTPNTGDGDGR